MEEDKYLYKEFLNGNKNAFEKLILKHKNNIVYFITRYIKNIELSEDIFQDVIVYILEKKEKYDFNYSFKTYMYMIAKSKAIDYLKHEKYTESIEEQEYVDEQLLEEIIFSKERKTKIQNVINKMPSDYQIVIYLTQIEGISYKETAKIMEKTERQIKTLAYNARKKLRQLLIEERVIKMKGNRVIRLLLLFVIVGVLTSGIVYASISIYNAIWKEPVKYNLRKEDNIEVKDGLISKDKAKTICNEYIKKLGYIDEKITDVEYLNSELHDYYLWRVRTENKLVVDIKAENGDIDGFIDNNNYEIEKKNIDKDDASLIIKNYYNILLENDNNYSLVEISNEGNEWTGYFYKNYAGIYNKYEGVKITVIPELKKVTSVRYFEEKYEDTEIIVSKEEAIEIIKNKIGQEQKINLIEAELSIEKMNAFVYAQDNPIESENEVYKVDNIIRKVWKVKVMFDNANYADIKYYYVDVETGEIIGGDAQR